MKSGDSVSWRKDLLLYMNGGPLGQIIDYNSITTTFTFKRFSLWKRLWLRLTNRKR